MDQLLGIPIVVYRKRQEDIAARSLELLRLGRVIGLIEKPFTPELVRQYLQNLVSTLASENQWDEITGLYTRSKFLREMDAMLEENPKKSYVLGCLNIRGFRLINDMYEMPVGDSVLRAVSQGLRDTLAVEKNKPQLALVREYTRGGPLMWISVGISFLEQRAGRDMFCLSIRDIMHLAPEITKQRAAPEKSHGGALCDGREKIMK